MSAIKRINYDINNHSPCSLPYNIYKVDLCNEIKESTYLATKLYTKINNNLELFFYISKDYPFKPPTVYLYSKCLGPYMSYTKWLNNISQSIYKHSHLTTSHRILAYFFSYKNNSKYNINLNNSYQCLCCNSLTCSNNWLPNNSIINIIEEFIINKKFLFFTSKLGIKLLYPIFHNDRWSLSDDLILYIHKFISL